MLSTFKSIPKISQLFKKNYFFPEDTPNIYININLNSNILTFYISVCIYAYIACMYICIFFISLYFYIFISVYFCIFINIYINERTGYLAFHTLKSGKLFKHLVPLNAYESEERKYSYLQTLTLPSTFSEKLMSVWSW